MKFGVVKSLLQEGPVVLAADIDPEPLGVRPDKRHPGNQGTAGPVPSRSLQPGRGPAAGFSSQDQPLNPGPAAGGQLFLPEEDPVGLGTFLPGERSEGEGEKTSRKRRWRKRKTLQPPPDRYRLKKQRPRVFLGQGKRAGRGTADGELQSAPGAGDQSLRQGEAEELPPGPRGNREAGDLFPVQAHPESDRLFQLPGSFDFDLPDQDGLGISYGGDRHQPGFFPTQEDEVGIAEPGLGKNILRRPVREPGLAGQVNRVIREEVRRPRIDIPGERPVGTDGDFRAGGR